MTEIKKSNSIAMIRTSGLTYEYRYALNDDSNISTDNTRKTAEQEFTVTIALKGVDLTIQKGEFVAVLGHNGSGKSTLAKQFNALLTPTHGAVWVIGLDTKMEENVWRIRQHAGMVFQNPDNQIIASVVEEDIAFGPENMGVPPEEIRQRVDEALRAVGMSEYADYSPHYLSGGQKQRIGIAGVLAMKPECIILDEPTAMLDPLGRNDVIATITRLNREEGITVILITHYMDEAVKADRVIVMDDGRTVMDGAPKEVFKNVEELRTIGLDVPQVAEIAHKLRKQGFSLDGSILTIEEMAEALLKVKKKED